MLSDRPLTRISKPEPAEKMTVLVADDDVLAARNPGKNSQEMGLRVVRAKNGDDAWTRSKEKEFARPSWIG